MRIKMSVIGCLKNLQKLPVIVFGIKKYEDQKLPISIKNHELKSRKIYLFFDQIA